MEVAYSTYTTASADYGGGGGNLSVGVPSGLASGDLWLISSTVNNFGGAGDQIGVATGFAAVSPAQRFSAAPEQRSQYKVAGSSESSASIAFASPSYLTYAFSARFTGTHASTPIGNVVTGTASSGSGSATVAPGTLMVQDAGSAVVVHVSFYPQADAGAITPASGYTEAAEYGAANAYLAASLNYKLRGAGSETPGNFTCTSASVVDERVAQAIEIRPSAGGTDGTITGTTLTATTSLIAGALQTSNTFAGQTLTVTASVIAGALQVSSTINGQTLTTTVSLTTGALQAGSSIAGQTITATVSLVPGALSTSSDATLNGQILTAVASVIAGALQTSNTLAGQTLTANVTLVPGTLFEGTPPVATSWPNRMGVSMSISISF